MASATNIRSVQPALHGSTKPIVTIPMFVLRGNNFVEKTFAIKCFSICLLVRVLYHHVTLMHSDHLSTKVLADMWGEMVGAAQRASLVKSAEQGKEHQAPNICFAVSPRIERL